MCYKLRSELTVSIHSVGPKQVFIKALIMREKISSIRKVNPFLSFYMFDCDQLSYIYQIFVFVLYRFLQLFFLNFFFISAIMFSD